VTGRGGQGIWNVPSNDSLRADIGPVVGVFPITVDEQLMMVTDQGKLIRTPVHDVRIASRNTKGVTLFKVADNEKIVSVAKLHEADDDEDDEDSASEVDEGNAEDAADIATDNVETAKTTEE
jgi:DNA gyrase subunit A